MANQTLGKNQSYSREINNKLVINSLKNESRSATELADILHLSNATMSSILKDLLAEGLIKIDKTESVKGCGRKQVLYSINEEYGLTLNVNISNYTETVSISNMKEQILAKDMLGVEKYDAATIYLILLRSTKLLMEEKFKNIPLRNIVISLPGRVNNKTGELILSKQFNPELFKEQNFIKNVFNKQYPGVPVHIANDINVSATAELMRGNLQGVRNAIYISIDMGIGGALIINGKLFEGDQGYTGEFGLIKATDNGVTNYLDGFVSFRVLLPQAESLLRTNLENSRSALVEAFHSNQKVKNVVLHSASILGRALTNLVEILDISRIVIGGRAVEFGDEYLDAIKNEMHSLIYQPEVTFSSLGTEAKVIGASAMAVDYVLRQATKK